MTPKNLRAALAVALAALLAGCLLTPGKFNASLDVRRDGQFTYSYTGEIYLLALSKLAEMGRDAGGKAVFEASTCYKDDMETERACTEAELRQQREDWDAAQTRTAEKNRREAESMRAMLGGIDPSDPKAAEELAARLRKQAGWKSVTYKGDGLFEVDFALTGSLDHDFAFPTIERFTMANSFVTLSRRSDGTVRLDAPGFGPAGTGGSFGAMMQGLALAGEGEASKPSLRLPTPEGRFIVTTDAQVIANNTDEGPQTDPRGQKLEWAVNPRTAAAPMAVLRLAAK